MKALLLSSPQSLDLLAEIRHFAVQRRHLVEQLADREEGSTKQFGQRLPAPRPMLRSLSSRQRSCLRPSDPSQLVPAPSPHAPERKGGGVRSRLGTTRKTPAVAPFFSDGEPAVNVGNALRANGEQDLVTVCDGCGIEVERQAAGHRRRGRPRRWCSNDCREAAIGSGRRTPASYAPRAPRNTADKKTARLESTARPHDLRSIPHPH